MAGRRHTHIAGYNSWDTGWRIWTKLNTGKGVTRWTYSAMGCYLPPTTRAYLQEEFESLTICGGSPDQFIYFGRGNLQFRAKRRNIRK